jgi:DNA repair exonuclease SbcCD ATPase subunit
MKKEKDEIIERFLTCRICKKGFKHLGSHIWHKHKITAREYKSMFGLPYKWGLISQEIKEKKRKIASWQQTWKKNFRHWRKYAFKKGQKAVRRMTPVLRKVLIERIIKVNRKRKPEKCPVCNMVFDNLDSHLVMKHKLLRIKRKDL